jgi:hypothetical protein
VPARSHPLGFRPGSEGGTTPALAVTINAIVDALADFGVTHVEMPATPSQIWQAIAAAKAQRQRDGRGSEPNRHDKWRNADGQGDRHRTGV